MIQLLKALGKVYYYFVKERILRIKPKQLKNGSI